mmetsp:Transcript_7235/g.9823  ORF Transcript_7235/g.9823 Transcript_7235/m.9823 type:complete len:151 (+) Transcript_7235:43-495(+)
MKHEQLGPLKPNTQLLTISATQLKQRAAELERKYGTNKETFSACTPFRLRVYAACTYIPRGKVSTYASLATLLGVANGSRAVGQALRHNPFAPFVPCHRVVNSTGALHGFGGQTTQEALLRKMKLLQNEGVVFDAAGKKRVHPTSRVTFV